MDATAKVRADLQNLHPKMQEQLNYCCLSMEDILAEITKARSMLGYDNDVSLHNPFWPEKTVALANAGRGRARIYTPIEIYTPVEWEGVRGAMSALVGVRGCEHIRISFLSEHEPDINIGR